MSVKTVEIMGVGIWAGDGNMMIDDIISLFGQWCGRMLENSKLSGFGDECWVSQRQDADANRVCRGWMQDEWVLTLVGFVFVWLVTLTLTKNQEM